MTHVQGLLRGATGHSEARSTVSSEPQAVATCGQVPLPRRTYWTRTRAGEPSMVTPRRQPLSVAGIAHAIRGAASTTSTEPDQVRPPQANDSGGPTTTRALGPGPQFHRRDRRHSPPMARLPLRPISPPGWLPHRPPPHFSPLRRPWLCGAGGRPLRSTTCPSSPSGGFCRHLVDAVSARCPVHGRGGHDSAGLALGAPFQ